MATEEPRHSIAMALHREHCGERSPQATHPADWDCHLIDADAALQALTVAGYTVLPTDQVTAARQSYELKVQDLARETARLGKLIDVLALHGHSADDTARRCLACSICRALREVTGAEATR